MTRVDFYVLGDGAGSSPEVLACKLTEKAYKLGHRIYIHTASPEQAARLDDLLWTFRAGSFVPHALCPDVEADDPAPVWIGCDAAPQRLDDVMVNLAPEVPAFFSRFERVAELVGGSHEDKQSARVRFRFYRDRGYELQTHNL
jgi:DNA polymerase-3 subunit chi